MNTTHSTNDSDDDVFGDRDNNQQTTSPSPSLINNNSSSVTSFITTNQNTTTTTSTQKSKKSKKDKKDKKDKTNKKSKKKLKSYEKFEQAQEKRGVVYLARIPPYMKPAKLQHLLEQYGKVTNLHCVEEDRSLRRRRRKAGGNTKKNYVEGWVEYEDKKIAKNVARCLNNTQIGGKKKSYYHHDIWNMKYLRGFKWRHLTEKVQYERRMRDQRLKAEINRAKRENNAYVSQIEKGREIKKMEERKLARQQQKGGKNSGDRGSSGGSVEDERNKIRRQFRQIAPIGADQVREKLNTTMLGKVFSNGGKRKSSDNSTASKKKRRK